MGSEDKPQAQYVSPGSMTGRTGSFVLCYGHKKAPVMGRGRFVLGAGVGFEPTDALRAFSASN